MENKKIIGGVSVLMFIFLISFVVAGSLSLSPVPEEEKIKIETSLKIMYPQLKLEKVNYVTEINLSKESREILNTRQTKLIVENNLIVEVEYTENKLSPVSQTKKIYKIG